MVQSAQKKVVPMRGRKPLKSDTIAKAAGKNKRELLIALRDKIAAEIDDGVAARDLAALSRRVLEITDPIEELDAEGEGDDVGSAAATPDEPWEGYGLHPARGDRHHGLPVRPGALPQDRQRARPLAGQPQ